MRMILSTDCENGMLEDTVYAFNKKDKCQCCGKKCQCGTYNIVADAKKKEVANG